MARCSKNVGAVYELAFRIVRKPPRPRDGFGDGLSLSLSLWPRKGFVRIELRGRRSILARSSFDFVAGIALSQGQVSILWQAQHFRKHSLQAGGWQDAENVGAVRELVSLLFPCSFSSLPQEHLLRRPKPCCSLGWSTRPETAALGFSVCLLQQSAQACGPTRRADQTQKLGKVKASFTLATLVNGVIAMAFF